MNVTANVANVPFRCTSGMRGLTTWTFRDFDSLRFSTRLRFADGRLTATMQHPPLSYESVLRLLLSVNTATAPAIKSPSKIPSMPSRSSDAPRM